jgi:sirohydrochlorin cobaltochelatase
MRILFIYHGSRLKDNNQQYEIICRNIALILPQHDIYSSYLNFSNPLFDDCLDHLLSKGPQVLIVPLFFFNAKHTKEDIPNIINKNKKKHLNTQINLINISHSFTASMLDEINQQRLASTQKTTVIIIGRGSSDHSAVNLFNEHIEGVSSNLDSITLSAFCDMAQPNLNECLKQSAHIKSTHIVIFPYFLFKGKLLDDICTDISLFKKSHSNIKVSLCEPFGYHKNFAQTITNELSKNSLI